MLCLKSATCTLRVLSLYERVMERPRIPMTQMKLDFGQRNFRNARCEGCGMVYTTADKDEQKVHALYHRDVLFASVKLPRGKHQRVLEEHFDGYRVAELLLSNHSGQKYFARISQMMGRDLGHDKPGIIGPGFSTYSLESVSDDWRVFMYVRDKSNEILGCCVVEVLTTQSVTSRHYGVHRLEGGRASILAWRVQHESSEDKVPAARFLGRQKEDAIIHMPLCGVRRLWVCKKYRRKGVATKLLDCVLKYLIYGHTLERSQIAFAEPTADGTDFAAFFVGREDFLVY
ncbi:unnamed protein product [Calicophoron daubneyi]|uniref:N-acetyltransferase ESCO1 n=1 Tax=Calicophoron daubneyi TaxID=300641 RepID=A0AAV2T077_CALDB